jgi:pimeloyl-ACP methyl ester carboxylesterase
VRDYLRMGPRRLWREFSAMRAHAIAPALAAAAVPTLVVRGAHDPLASTEWCRAVAAAAGDGALAVVPDAGHAVNYSDAAALADRVEGFLAATADRAGTAAGSGAAIRAR